MSRFNVMALVGHRVRIRETLKRGATEFTAEIRNAENLVDSVYYTYVPDDPMHGAWGCTHEYDVARPFGHEIVEDLGEVRLASPLW